MLVVAGFYNLIVLLVVASFVEVWFFVYLVCWLILAAVAVPVASY